MIREIHFGEYPALSLRDARERHGAYRDLVKAGIDPKEYDKAQREEEARRLENEARIRHMEEQATSIRELVAEYVKKWAKPRKRSWWQQHVSQVGDGSSRNVHGFAMNRDRELSNQPV